MAGKLIIDLGDDDRNEALKEKIAAREQAEIEAYNRRSIISEADQNLGAACDLIYQAQALLEDVSVSLPLLVVKLEDPLNEIREVRTRLVNHP